MHRCGAVRLPLPNLNLLVLYYSMFMGGLFIWVSWRRAGERLEGGNSVYCPYAVLIHAGVKIPSLLVHGKDSGCQFNTSCFACHNN